MFDLVVKQPLPLHPTYSDDQQARRFWRTSFKAGRKYQDGRDAYGDDILIKHARETTPDYRLRKRYTPVRDYTGTIIRRYNDFVFRSEPDITAGRPEAQTLVENADGRGTTIVDFFRRRLRTAQVDGISFILPRSNVPVTSDMTMAQALEVGARQILTPIDADSVVNWTRYDGALTAALVVLDTPDGMVANEYDSRGQMRQARLSRNAGQLIVESVTAWQPTGYDRLPLIDLWPAFDDMDINGNDGHGESQASPIAEVHRAIYNVLSLLTTEMYDNTFTQHVLFGADATEFAQQGDARGANADPSVTWSTKKMMCVPNAAGKLESAGSDVAQADSLRKTLTMHEETLYQLAGIASGEAVAQAQSGVALAFRNNDLTAILSALAKAVESAFNRTMAVVGNGYGIDDFASLSLPGDYSPADLEAELRQVVTALSVPALPAVVKSKIARRFVNRNFTDLTEDEEQQLDSELLSLSVTDLTTRV